MTNRCKNITLATTSLRPVNKFHKINVTQNIEKSTVEGYCSVSQFLKKFKMCLTFFQCVDPVLRRTVPSFELELVFALHNSLHDGARQGARDPGLRPAHVVLPTPQPQVMAQTHLQTYIFERFKSFLWDH